MNTKTKEEKSTRELIIGKLSSFIEDNASNAKIYILIPVFVQIFLCCATLLMPKLYGLVLICVQIALIFATIEVYRSFAYVLETGFKSTYYKCIPLSAGMASMYIVPVGLCVLSRVVHANLFLVAIGFGFISVLLTIAIFNTKKLLDFKEKAMETPNLYERFGIKFLKPGDVVLCQSISDIEAGFSDTRAIIPKNDRFLHMLVLGATGTGKTSQILLPMVTQDLQNPDVGVLILEPKGDYAQQVKFIAEHYGRPCKYFDPTMDDCPHFNPMAGLEVEVVENMATTFNMMAADSKDYFKSMGEQLIRNAVTVLKRLDRDTGIDGQYSNLITLSRLVQNSNSVGYDLINKFQNIQAPTDEESKQNQDIASYFLNDYFPARSKAYESTSEIRAQLAKLCSNEYLRDVLNPQVLKGEKNDINFDKALEDGEVICMSTTQGALGGLSRFLGYFLILQLQSAIFRRPGTENTRRPAFLYIDEFQTYANANFGNVLMQGRSYRVGAILATQARAQVEMGVGKDGKAFLQTVSTNARNVVVFPGASVDDALYYEKQFGSAEQEEEIVTKSHKTFNPLMGGLNPLGHPSKSIRTQAQDKPNFTASDLIYGKFGEIIYSTYKYNNIQPAKRGKVSWIDSDLKHEIDDKINIYLREHTKKTREEMYKEKLRTDDDNLIWEEEENPVENVSDINRAKENIPEAVATPFQAEPAKPKAVVPDYIETVDDDQESEEENAFNYGKWMDTNNEN